MARTRKRFGQHFLEPAWVTKLVDATAPAATDLFIEIGPGAGALTRPLAARVEALVAIEVDRDLAADLERQALANVRVITGDVLDADLAAVARDLGGATRPVRVAGNLPYNISSPILFRLLEAAKSGLLTDATLLLQKEVADRLVAPVGIGDYGVLTLSVQLGADVTRLLALPPGAFRPMPKVRSSLVRLSFRPPPAFVHHPELLVDIVRSVFTQRRKTMGNAFKLFASSRGLAAHDLLTAAGIDPQRRPETLDLADYARLADGVTAGVPPRQG